MHEEYYGFIEKPFNLTPDPKYLYKSQSHANAFDLLQYAIRRREGFVVITGDIGTGKTTLCRAVLEHLDRRTFTALVLNPFLSEEDLLRLILQDFGVVSRDEMKRGRLAGVSKQELIDTLNEFLLSLQPLRAGALLIIDEAQNLPLQVLEQIRILSNLETDKEKLLQIVLVGQLNLQELLRSPSLRQLDQRISIRYELKPLDRDETAAYIAHRLAIAGGGAAVSFDLKAQRLIHTYSGGIPRLINLLCDRALLGGFSARTPRITAAMVHAAAAGLELKTARPPVARWMRERAGAFAAGAAAMAVVAALTYGALFPQEGRASAAVLPQAVTTPEQDEPAKAAQPVPSIEMPAPVQTSGTQPAPPPSSSRYSIVVGSFRQPSESTRLTTELAEQGYAARAIRVDAGPRGIWHQVRVGPYTDAARARADEARIRQIPGYADARLTAH